MTLCMHMSSGTRRRLVRRARSRGPRGAQSDLGSVIVYARQFAVLDRMFLVALFFLLYTAVSTGALGRLTARMLAWAPEGRRS